MLLTLLFLIDDLQLIFSWRFCIEKYIFLINFEKKTVTYKCLTNIYI